MIYSATRAKLALAGEDPRYYLKRQVAFLVIGLVVLVVTALFDYRRLEQISTILYVGIVLGSLAVLSPVGSHAQGSQRWFSLGALQLQPSEFATLVLIIAIATYCARGDPTVSTSATWSGWCCSPRSRSCWSSSSPTSGPRSS